MATPFPGGSPNATLYEDAGATFSPVTYFACFTGAQIAGSIERRLELQNIESWSPQAEKDVLNDQTEQYCPIINSRRDLLAQCHDVRGNQVTIGFANGQVLSFDIDCGSLHSEMPEAMMP